MPATGFSIAVFPLENLSGASAPLKAIRMALIGHLARKGIRTVDEQVLEEFMLRNRIRYAAGLDEATAQALEKETGAKGVLVPALELFSESQPPKIALSARLVSTGATPVIQWIDGVGMAGDDNPGILLLGLIEDPEQLLDKALERLTGSLADHLSHKAVTTTAGKAEGRFQPKIVFRSSKLEAGRKYTVAVVPFFNKSERRNAGEIMALQFIRAFKRIDHYEVIEPGVVRKAFLSQRIIMDEGVSLTDANVLFASLNADLILGGTVLDYQDYQGIYGRPKVNFNVQLMEKTTRQVVWSSMSHNQGDDGVFFFDFGKINTAHAMATRMVGAVGTRMITK